LRRLWFERFERRQQQRVGREQRCVEWLEQRECKQLVIRRHLRQCLEQRRLQLRIIEWRVG
jgi:hypothetical protein